jgi:hypothetical protein
MLFLPLSSTGRGRKVDPRPVPAIAAELWKRLRGSYIGQVAILGVTCLLLSCFLSLKEVTRSPVL